MSEFQPRFTDDGSVGLFSKEVDDIYHASYGALSEAYEKFILPANFYNFFKNNKDIKILDICYGIGYNSKAFLNLYFQKFKKEFNCINSIDTDNIPCKNFCKLTLHGIEIDKNLIKLSPFITQQKTNKIHERFEYYKKKKEYKDFNFNINNIVNIILLEKIYEKYQNNYIDKEVVEILSNKEHKKFFNSNFTFFIKNYNSQRYKLPLTECLKTLLHNIYYRYISNSYKNLLKLSKNHLFDVDIHNIDAREFLKSTNYCYDFVFLDAFTPAKTPNLWTLEFFEQLYKHTSENCLILTYSNSAAIRNALLMNNFFVGKNFILYENKFMGTIASKNKNLIDFPLDDYDLGLINTKAGIPFHDNKNLSLSNEDIIKNRKKEVEASTLISTTKYKKEYKCHTI